MNLDKKYLVWALAYAVAGMSLGIAMAASGDHGQHVTHAHILLVGFVVSLVYAVIHKLWLGGRIGAVARWQFMVHQGGAIAMVSGLLLLYGGLVPAEQVEPLLSVGSIAVLSAAVMMLLLVARTQTAGQALTEADGAD